jgi:CheY-like chemotaxis protein
MAALKLFREVSIDFIITDFQMPNLNECEFLEILSRETISFPPVVMITGNPTNSVRMRAMHGEVVNHKQGVLR